MSRGIVPNFAAALSSFVVEDEIDIGAAPSSSAGAGSNNVAAAAPTTPSLSVTSPSPLARQQQASNSTFQSLDTHVAAARGRFDAAKLRCESLVAAISRAEPLGRGVSAESPSFVPSPSSSPGGADAQPKPSAIAVEQLRAQADEAEKELKSALRELNALLQEEVVRATAAEVAKADEQLKMLLNA